ncbi:hypothetical protein, partial [Streptomyces sp. SA3_actF]|uniref:hypothetical protein n=1 Tax=Streptomyces sp. SA3_actF TaxID=682181 RepID=UPI0002000B75
PRPRPLPPPDAALTPTEDGTALALNRPPRLHPPAPAHRFRLPPPVPPHEPRPLPWLMAAAPLLCALVSVALFGRWYYLALAALSPVLLLATHCLDKRHGRTSHAVRLKKYAAHKARVEAAARDALAAERRTRLRTSPTPPPSSASRPAPAPACGSAAAPTPTTSSSASAPAPCPPPSSSTTPPPTNTSAPPPESE